MAVLQLSDDSNIGRSSLSIQPIFGKPGWYVTTKGILWIRSRRLSSKASSLDIFLALSI